MRKHTGETSRRENAEFCANKCQVNHLSARQREQQKSQQLALHFLDLVEKMRHICSPGQTGAGPGCSLWNLGWGQGERPQHLLLSPAVTAMASPLGKAIKEPHNCIFFPLMISLSEKYFIFLNKNSLWKTKITKMSVNQEWLHELEFIKRRK